MAIILVAPAVATAIPALAGAGAGAAAAGGIGAFAAKLLATTAISTALSFAASALQPKASASGGETSGRMVSTSNTGADPRTVILGTFRDAGTLIWHTEHEGHKVKVTQVIQLCDEPIDQYVSEVIDGSIEPLVPNESQTVKGHESGGTGFNFGDTPTPDSQDWVPVVGTGGHGDIWRKTDAPTNLYRHRGNRWEVMSGATFHDLSSVPGAGLGVNGDIAINRTTGIVYFKRGGFWRERAKTTATAGANDNTFYEANGVPGDKSRYLHWENGDRRWRWHFKVRYYDGTQTTADSYLMAVADPSSDWTSACVGNNRAYKVVTQRYYPAIYPNAWPVQTASILRGVKVYDPRRAATGTNVSWYGTTVKSNQVVWTENAALLAAFIKCWPGLPGNVPYSEIDEAELIASANVCAQTITNPDATIEPRYTINGIVASTESRDSVEEALEIALGGHIFRRGGKWVIWAGRARAVTATFDERNITAIDYSYQPGAGIRDRKNTVIGTWYSPATNYSQVSMKKVQPADMLSADGDRVLTESIHFRFAARSRFTPRRLAKIWLHQRRAEANSLTINLDVTALDLSPLDVLEINDKFVGFLNSRFVAADLASTYLSAAGSPGEAPEVRCILYAYDPNTWDAPGEDPTEEHPHIPRVRDVSTVDPPASIAVGAVNGRAILDIDGKLLANVRIEVGRSPDLRATEYQLQYRMSPENFISPASAFWGDGSDYDDESDWASLNKVPAAERDVFNFNLKSLYDGAYYDFRVAAFNDFGASSDAFTDDEWTRQIDAHLITTGRVAAGRPGTPTLDYNEIVNPNFKQGSTGWEYRSAASGTTEWVDNAGRFGGPSTRITIVSHDRSIRPDADEMIPVEVGQRRRFRFWRKVTNADAGTMVDIVLQARYYQSDRSTNVTDANVAVLQTNTGTTGYQLVAGSDTVPSDPDIAFMRLEAHAKYTNGPYTVRFDAFQQKRVLGATGPMLTDVTTINNTGGAGLDWEVLRSITVGKPGDPVELTFSFEGRIGNPGSPNQLATSGAQFGIRVQRFDEDGTSNETNIMAEIFMGNDFDDTGSTASWGRWEVLLARCSDDSLDAGTFIYRAQFRTNRTNARAAVRNRIMGWRLENAG